MTVGGAKARAGEEAPAQSTAVAINKVARSTCPQSGTEKAPMEVGRAGVYSAPAFIQLHPRD